MMMLLRVLPDFRWNNNFEAERELLRSDRESCKEDEL